MDPQVLVNILVEIAELEQLQAQARHTIASNEKRDRDLAELQADYEADADEAAAQVQEQARGYRTLSREIRETEDRLKDRRDKLVGISDRRQHRALTEEITSLENRLERLETEAITLLDAEESGQQAAAQVQQESRQQQAKSQSAHEDMDRQSRQMSARLENIGQELDRLVSMLPPAEKRHLQRLQGKLDLAVVHQQNGACCGCFHQLPVQEAINVDRGRTVVRCPSCLRYIVHRPWK